MYVCKICYDFTRWLSGYLIPVISIFQLTRKMKEKKPNFAACIGYTIRVKCSVEVAPSVITAQKMKFSIKDIFS